MLASVTGSRSVVRVHPPQQELKTYKIMEKKKKVALAITLCSVVVLSATITLVVKRVQKQEQKKRTAVCNCIDIKNAADNYLRRVEQEECVYVDKDNNCVHFFSTCPAFQYHKNQDVRQRKYNIRHLSFRRDKEHSLCSYNICECCYMEFLMYLCSLQEEKENFLSLDKAYINKAYYDYAQYVEKAYYIYSGRYVGDYRNIVVANGLSDNEFAILKTFLSYNTSTIYTIYKIFIDNNVLSKDISEERFRQILQDDNQLKIYWEKIYSGQANKKGLYASDYNIFSASIAEILEGEHANLSSKSSIKEYLLGNFDTPFDMIETRIDYQYQRYIDLCSTDSTLADRQK